MPTLKYWCVVCQATVEETVWRLYYNDPMTRGVCLPCTRSILQGQRGARNMPRMAASPYGAQISTGERIMEKTKHFLAELSEENGGISARNTVTVFDGPIGPDVPHTICEFPDSMIPVIRAILEEQPKNWEFNPEIWKI